MKRLETQHGKLWTWPRFPDHDDPLSARVWVVGLWREAERWRFGQSEYFKSVWLMSSLTARLNRRLKEIYQEDERKKLLMETGRRRAFWPRFVDKIMVTVGRWLRRPVRRGDAELKILAELVPDIPPPLHSDPAIEVIIEGSVKPRPPVLDD